METKVGDKVRLCFCAVPMLAYLSTGIYEVLGLCGRQIVVRDPKHGVTVIWFSWVRVSSPPAT